MAFNRKTWHFKFSKDHEYSYAGKYGAKGEKRAKKKKATPEQIAKQNQTNKEIRVWRVIRENYDKGDLWVTLKYPAGTRKHAAEMTKDLMKFCAKCRKEYKKYGEPFKFIVKKEIGKQGGSHIHILVNNPDSMKTEKILAELWEHGTIHYTTVYRAGGFKALAEYIVKQPDEETEKQLSLFPEERKEFVRYSCSRNLTRPEPEVKQYSHRTVKKLIENGPEPTPGYYIDENSIRCGVNPYTGLSYLKYTEYLIGENPPEAEENPWEFG